MSIVILARNPLLAQETGRFTLGTNERVALIGDALLDDDAAHGFLEYFFVTQRPKASIDTRNFAWILTTAGTNGVAKSLPTTNALEALRQRLDAFRPTIAVVGFGLSSGTPEVAEVTDGLNRVIAAVQQSAGTNPVRLILLSPLRREQVAPPLELAAVNRQISNVVAAVETVAKERSARFINLYDRLINGQRQPPPPPLISGDGHLTGYGCRRMAEYVVYLIGFEPPRWRFGVLTNGTLRQGGFGITILETNRTSERARFVIKLANMPLPALPTNETSAFVITPENRVQVVGMNPGTYEFKIDGQTIDRPTEKDLAQSIAVKSGPHYELAAQLRDAIVKRHQLRRERQSGTGSLKAEDVARLEAEIAALDKRIATLRVPGTNVIEIVPVAPSAGVSP